MLEKARLRSCVSRAVKIKVYFSEVLEKPQLEELCEQGSDGVECPIEPVQGEHCVCTGAFTHGEFLVPTPDREQQTCFGKLPGCTGNRFSLIVLHSPQLILYLWSVSSPGWWLG